MALWKFRAHRPDEKIRNPIQGEFFSEEAVERPAQALVREVIQNSLDARAGEAPVEVRFTVSEADGLGEETARSWLGGAWPHLAAEGNGLRGVPGRPGPGRFLAIEDFGTTGLEGDPAQLRPEGAPSRLFAFFRAEGISQKSGKDAGRWGVGKTVFLRSSDVNTILGLTVRASDGSCLVFGQSVLRYHWLGGTYFTPDGAFGTPCGEAIVPSSEAPLTERLRHDFALARGSGPGLSIVVPYASEELTAPAILEAVMREYFYPILSGRLVVTVAEAARPDAAETLDADSLREKLVEARGDVEQNVGPLAALTLWLNRVGLEGAVALEPAPPGKPEWSAAAIPAASREVLADTYRRGDPLLLRIPLAVHPVGEAPVPTFFHVALRRDLVERGAAPAFVRNGIQIPKALERRVRGQSLWALVVVEDQPIATLLGDAETPAHTHWSKDTQNFRNKYRYGAATIDFVRAAPRFLAETLSETVKGRDFVSLADFFPVPAEGPAPAEPGARDAEEAEEAAVPPEPPVEIARSAGPFRIERLDGGFRVSASRPPEAGSLEVDVAYDRTRGNPLRRWDRRDFDLAALPKRLDGLELVRCEGNAMSVRHGAEPFGLEVTGFDPNRDLLVRVSPLEEPA